MAESVWYEDGLRFRCTRCGNCCRGPGYVWVNDEEIAALAKHLEMDVFKFESFYTYKAGRNRSLRESAGDDCIFYEHPNGCTVYEARPGQCRAWPFWASNVETREDWEVTQKRCPGSGQGELYSAEEITKKLAMTRL